METSELSRRLQNTYDVFVNIIFSIILIFIILGIAIGAVQLFVSVWGLLKFQGISGHYIGLVADVLTLYVMVELSRSLVEYFATHRLRLTFIVDAAIVFLIREIMIALFKHEIEYEMIYALSALLFVLGALRIGSVMVYQREKKMAVETKP